MDKPQGRAHGKTAVYMDAKAILARIGTSGQIVDLFAEYGIPTRPNTIAKWRAQRYLPFWAYLLLQKANVDGKLPAASAPGFGDIECIVAERGDKVSTIDFPAANKKSDAA